MAEGKEVVEFYLKHYKEEKNPLLKEHYANALVYWAKKFGLEELIPEELRGGE